MHTRTIGILVAFAASIGTGCEADPTTVLEDGSGPTPDFDRFCGDNWWEDTVTDDKIPALDGDYYGWFDMPVGTVFSQKIIPDHPFQVEDIRVKFNGSAGPVRVRLTTSLGRSYPDVDGEGSDLVIPFEQTIDPVDPDKWVTFDVGEQDVFLFPTQHYHIVSEQLDGGPTVTKETLPADGSSQALMLVPGEFFPWSTDANFRMKLRGQWFCQWEEEERWFTEQTHALPPSHAPHVTDLNSDDHDDLVMSDGTRPYAFLGDGEGGFTELPDAFPEDLISGTTLFADLDNDGDVDAFTTTWASSDSDGDGYDKSEDCNDTDPEIHPEAQELEENGRDDDCDGTADDGTSGEDADTDGVTIADGDCDDTLAEVYPSALELADNLDNDCDGTTDETTQNHVLLNDGTGIFSILDDAGVESWDQSTAAGLGDGNGDGVLDLYYGNWLIEYPWDPAWPDAYFEGTGDGRFVDAFDAAGLELPTPYSAYGVLWNDYDDDGDQDIYVSNYHLYPNQLWQNQGDGTYQNVGNEVGVARDDIPSGSLLLTGGHSYGGDFGDFDNDGDMDLYVANLAHPREYPWSDPSQFLVNQGPPDYHFEPATAELGFIYDEGDFNATFADFDNDMDLDIAIASIYPDHYSRLYRNEGDRFVDISYETGLAVHDTVSLVWADFDEDGDLDIVIEDHIFENLVGQDQHWIALRLEGVGSNRDALGARVWLTAGGITQVRDVKGPGAHVNAQSSRTVHFGLGSHTVIDELTVRWVGGAMETISHAEVDQRMAIVEGSGTAQPL